MGLIKLDDAIVGSVLTEPIELNGILLINKGVALSKTLKMSLKKFGITEINSSSVFNESYDKNKLQFGKFDNLTYLAVKKLNIDDIVLCARTLVDNLQKDKSYGVLNTLFDYDEGTYSHSVNVACIALTVGMEIGLSIKELEWLAIGSLLHDIGKLNIPREILNKPSSLTDEERAIIQKHPEYGKEMLSEYKALINEPIRQIVYQHHEDFDGTGYPLGLKDFHSYKLARIVHICDVYEALCAKRPYKPALDKQVVWHVMRKQSGVKFDPFLFRQFERCIPMYTVGEEIVIRDKVGIVTDVMNNTDNPLIFYEGNILLLHDVQKLSDEELDYLSKDEGLITLTEIY